MKTFKTILMICGGLFVLVLLVTLLMPDSEETDSNNTDPSVTSAEDFYASDNENNIKENNDNATGSVQYLNTAQFSQLVSNIKDDKNRYIGSGPCVVDFYADWCGPCKELSPIIDKMAKKYAGKVAFYKVDVDQTAEITNAYGIQSIPTLFFCSDGKIESIAGAPDESQLEEMIRNL